MDPKMLAAMHSAAFRGADGFVDNPIWQRFSVAGQKPTVRIPPDIVVDIDNQIGGVTGSSTPAVNGVYTIPAGASLTLVLGGTGYRPAILRKLTLDSPSADFALCTVTFSTPSTGKSFQLGTNYPARAFAPGSFNNPQLHVAINSTVTTNCIVTNGGAAAVALTVGVELN